MNVHESLRIKQTQTLKSPVLLKLKTDFHWGLAYISDYDISVYILNTMHSQKSMNLMHDKAKYYYYLGPRQHHTNRLN